MMKVGKWLDSLSTNLVQGAGLLVVIGVVIISLVIATVVLIVLVANTAKLLVWLLAWCTNLGLL